MMRIALVGAIALLTAAPAWAGERTERVQTTLVEGGFQPGPVDGLYGPRSRNAVREFQRMNGLAAHGWLDRATRDRIAELGLVLGEVVPLEMPGRVAGAKGVHVPVTDPPGDEDREAVIELYAAATADEVMVRLAAIHTLGEVRTERAAAALGAVLLTEPETDLRITAARQLGSYGNEGALALLARALDFERDPEVRAVMTAEIERNLPVQLGHGDAVEPAERFGTRFAANAP